MLKKIFIGSLLVFVVGIIVVIAYNNSQNVWASGEQTHEQQYARQGWPETDFAQEQLGEPRSQQYGKRGPGQASFGRIGKAPDEAGYGRANPGQSGEGRNGELPPASNDEPLTEAEIDGLLKALDDEYHAWAIYDQVIEDFGQVRPFTNILRSEAQHISVLINLFDRYNVPVPDNAWVGTTESFDSVQAACTAGVEAEIANAALYDDLFNSTDRTDILTVYRDLQRASNDNHLAAFERCAQ